MFWLVVQSTYVQRLASAARLLSDGPCAGRRNCLPCARLLPQIASSKSLDGAGSALVPVHRLTTSCAVCTNFAEP